MNCVVKRKLDQLDLLLIVDPNVRFWNERRQSRKKKSTSWGGKRYFYDKSKYHQEEFDEKEKLDDGSWYSDRPDKFKNVLNESNHYLFVSHLKWSITFMELQLFTIKKLKFRKN